jgi:Zn ribbon nucleic-acid-binding protein
VCPRCGSDLATLALPETETVTCETCGYAGVEADHTGEPTAAESWAEAVERFQTTE